MQGRALGYKRGTSPLSTYAQFRRGRPVHVLVFVNFAKMVLVAALESPELSFPEAMEYRAFDIPFNDELVILLERRPSIII